MLGTLYNETSSGQVSAHEIARPALLAAIERLAALQQRGEPFVVADLGVAAGANAVSVARLVISEFMGRRPGEAISYAFEDLPLNDWTVLAQTVSAAELPCFTSFVPRSFYEPLFPPASLSLSLSFITLHWLSEAPRLSADAVLAMERHTAADVAAEWRDQAHVDLVSFLRLRATELKDGGEGVYLMVGGGAALPVHEWARPPSGGPSIFSVALSRAVAAGDIDEAAAMAASVAYHLRTDDEVRRAAGEVGASLELLDVTSAEVRVAEGRSAEEHADLAWAIHSNSILSSSGIGDEAGERVRLHLRDVVATEFGDSGATISYVSLAVRRRPREANAASEEGAVAPASEAVATAALESRRLPRAAPAGCSYSQRGWDPMWLARALADPARPTFLFGSTPPRDGTTAAEAAQICAKFVARSRAHASDGFIVYDIQDESSRNAESRPFPFRRTIDPSEYAQHFPPASGKSTVLYKAPAAPPRTPAAAPNTRTRLRTRPHHPARSHPRPRNPGRHHANCLPRKACSEADEAAFASWLDGAQRRNHHTLNLVGPSSSGDTPRISMERAAALVNERPGMAFGCVTIAERHLTKGTEHLNLLRKAGYGAKWFISQAVYDAEATIKLLHDYAGECRRRGCTPVKILLTFAPVGRPKTLQFVKWLGVHVPSAVEERILAKVRSTVGDATRPAATPSLVVEQANATESKTKEAAVLESIDVCCEAPQTSSQPHPRDPSRTAESRVSV